MKVLPSIAEQQLFKHRKICENGCWEWTGCVNNAGYGQIRYDKHLWLVHRFSLLYYRPEEVQRTEQVNHKCNNKLCFNPDHLYGGSKRDNTLDLMKTDRYSPPPNNNLNKTHCLRGHVFDETNTYTRPNGKRMCRMCSGQLQKERRSVLQADEI